MYWTYSRRALPLWLEIGKIEVKAACRPWLRRTSGGVSACRNSAKDSIWVASRKGASSTAARLAKLLRIRFFSV
jgi:hypothetical protein